MKAWRPGDLEDISDVEMWSGAPWYEPLEGDVDEAATARLASIPGKNAVRLDHGLQGRGGVPYQRAAGYEVVAWQNLTKWGGRTEVVPVPADRIRRTGDPDGKNSDRQAFIIDDQLGEIVEMTTLFPASKVTKSGLSAAAWWTRNVLRQPVRFDTNPDLEAGSVNRWDLDQPWDGQGLKGTAAIKAPLIPHVARPEEFDSEIRRVQMLAVTHYQPDRWVGYARGTDGDRKVKADVASPLIAGMRLRLRADR
jgi:hypothetical protein